MDEWEQSQKDFLTGFYTREHLISALLKKIIDAKVHNEKFSIFLVDIDHFKRINDKYGHLWGDEFLKYVGSTLRLTLEEKGSIFRYGGDEFVVLFSSSDPKAAYALARQFNTVMSNRPFLFNSRLFRITISCGLATYPDDAKGAEDLLKAADNALYFSKRYGRNTTTRFSKIPLQKFKMITIIWLEALLLAALVFFLKTQFFKESPKQMFERLLITRVFPLGVKAETAIVLHSGDVILGRIISEDNNRFVVSVALGRGTATMTIEKNLVKSVVNTKNGTKQSE